MYEIYIFTRIVFLACSELSVIHKMFEKHCYKDTWGQNDIIHNVTVKQIFNNNVPSLYKVPNLD